jgi:hypothetical protein
MAKVTGLPMSFTRYQASVPLGGPNRIWLSLLRKFHGHETLTAQDWQKRIDALKSKKISYDNLSRPAVAAGPRR